METAENKPSPGMTDAQADAWLTPGRYALALLILLVAAYPDVFRGRDTFFFRDFGYFGYPLAYYLKASFWNGELPLWNPLNNCGLPFLAQWNTLVLYPGSLFYVLLPLSWSLGFFCLGHLFLAGMGMYWLAHRWTGNRLAASVAGLAFTFNGLSLNCLMWPNNVAALGWMPIVVSCTERAWREGGTRLVLAALAGAMQMLAGAPELILFTWVFVGAAACVELARGTRARAQLLWRFSLVVLLVAGLAAAQMLPFLDLLRHSQRTESFATADWSMPESGWANLLVPMFRCFQNRQGVYFQHGQYWTSSYYMGIGVLALAILAAGQLRRRRVWLVAAAVILGLVLALGEHGYLYGWLRRVFPQFGLMRYPIKFIIAPVFGLPLLAAFAVRGYEEQSPAGLRRAWIWHLALGGVILVLIAGILWFEHAYPLNQAGWPDTWHSGLSRVGFLILIYGAWYALRQVEGARLKLLLRLSFLLLLGLDVITHAPRQNPTLPRSLFTANLHERYPEFRLDPLPTVGESRAMLSPYADRYLRYHSTDKPEQDYFFSRLGLFSNCNLLEGIPKVNGFFSLYVGDADKVINFIYTSTNRTFPGLYDFLGVSQITAPDRLVDWQRRDTYRPMATAGMKPVFLDDDAALAVLTSTNFNPREEVLLPPEASAWVTVTNTTQARVTRSSYTRHAAELEVEAEAPSLLVIAQAFYHPWQATVDGQPVRLLRANVGFQAIEVPAGSHTVRLRYEDMAFLRGVIVSGISAVLCLLLWWWHSFRDRRTRLLSQSQSADSVPPSSPSDPCRTGGGS